MNWLKRLFSKAPKQTTWVWCPGCDEDLCGNNSFIKDEGFVHYHCTNCGTSSVWEFETPVPILVSNS